jgi:hypothetical protein
MIVYRGGYYDNQSNTILFEPVPGEPYNALVGDFEKIVLEADVYFFVQLFPDEGGGGESGPENTVEQCGDGVDNDGDGRIDCDDPNCKKWCP